MQASSLHTKLRKFDLLLYFCIAEYDIIITSLPGPSPHNDVSGWSGFLRSLHLYPFHQPEEKRWRNVNLYNNADKDPEIKQYKNSHHQHDHH